MLIAGLFVVLGALMAKALQVLHRNARTGHAAVAFAAVLMALGVPMVLLGSPAGAAIVATVPMGTTESFSVLAATTVTNANLTTLNRDLGLSPGSSVTGFPPGVVTPPATMEIANAVAVQAQSDLTTAYDNAAGRSLDATTGADLAGLTLQGGVYAATTTKGALGLTGTVTLDGANNASSVFIFQTDSTLITASSSTVKLINGALACNVFWQVGSSATLGSSTTFVGNILALTSIGLDSGVTIDGRALARNGAVTLDNDTFTGPNCTSPTTTAGPTTTVAPTTTAPTTTIPGVTTTIPGVTTTIPGVTTTVPVTTIAPTSTVPGVTTTLPAATTVAPTSTLPAPTTTAAAATTIRPAATTVALAASLTTPSAAVTHLVAGATTTTAQGSSTVATTVPLVAIPRTGGSIAGKLGLAAVAYALGAAALVLADRARTRARA